MIPLPLCLNVEGLRSHVEACLRLKTCYLFGGLGKALTMEILRQQMNAYPKNFSFGRCLHLARLSKEQVYGFDCSGLLKSYWFGGIGAPRYTFAMDLNTAQMLAIARRRGYIKKMPEEAGLGVWLPGHVGVYMGEGRVVEATSNPAIGDGVVETRLGDRAWVFWFQIPFIHYR